MKQLKLKKKQHGISLMEIIAGLLVVALIIAGALALFSSADSSQKGNQMVADITALRSAVKSVYAGQGGYGTGSLNNVLKTAKKIPATMAVGTGNPPTITHTLNGSLTVQGVNGGSQFAIEINNIPTDICVQLLSGSASSGWNSIKVNSSAVITSLPMTPDTASTNCGTTNTNTITFTGA